MDDYINGVNIGDADRKASDLSRFAGPFDFTHDVSISGSTGSEGDPSDLYFFKTPTDGLATFTLSGLDANLDLIFYVYSEDMRRVRRLSEEDSDDTDNDSFSFDVGGYEFAVWYAVAVQGEASSYTLTVDLPPGEFSQPPDDKSLVEKVALLYEAALDRQPDNPGLNYFVGNTRADQSLQDISNSFYLADEFRNQFTSFDDQSYINQLYLNVLDRPADQAGFEYWEEQLDNGLSHADILVSFAESSENYDNAADWLPGLTYDPSSDMWLI